MTAAFGAGLVHITKFDENGDPVSWIDVPNVAAARVMMDSPDTCFLWNRKTGMRVDVLLDFPIPASEVLEDAGRVMLGADIVLPVASLTTLARLKEIALGSRNRQEDVLDLEFIRSKLSSPE